MAVLSQILPISMVSVVGRMQPVQMLLFAPQERLAEEQAQAEQTQGEAVTGAVLQGLPFNDSL